MIADKLPATQEAGVAQAMALPKPMVFTNGCFDILHRGHATYLEEARALGASLVVGINSDASVRRLNKGPDRPINCLDDRAAILAALESVSLVIAFHEDTPLTLIRALHPDVLVKGGDWPVDKIVGAQDVLAGGGRVVSIPFRFQRSTSALIEAIRR